MAKKTFFLAAIVVCLLMVVTGYRTQSSTAPSIGKNAPEVAYDPVDTAIKQFEKEGKYVLLSFWSASDASSRKAVNDYTAWLNANPAYDARIEFIAVNFDKEKPLYQEIVRIDSLREREQFNVPQEQGEVIKSRYDFNEVYGSVLIAPDGKIRDYNPAPGQLPSLTEG